MKEPKEFHFHFSIDNYRTDILGDNYVWTILFGFGDVWVRKFAQCFCNVCFIWNMVVLVFGIFPNCNNFRWAFVFLWITSILQSTVHLADVITTFRCPLHYATRKLKAGFYLYNRPGLTALEKRLTCSWIKTNLIH